MSDQVYPDSLEVETRNGKKMVRIGALAPNKVVRIKGHNIRVNKIPLTAGVLKCGHLIRGIAFSKGDVVFCEKHEEEDFVAEILSGEA